MQFPTFNLEASCQPITRQILRVKLSIEPTFEWADGLHGGAQPFWIFVEDNESQTLHHHETFLLTKKSAQMKEIQQVGSLGIGGQQGGGSALTCSLFV